MNPMNSNENDDLYQHLNAKLQNRSNQTKSVRPIPLGPAGKPPHPAGNPPHPAGNPELIPLENTIWRLELKSDTKTSKSIKHIKS